MCREDTKVNLKYFPGATMEDMESYVIPPLRRNPDEVIIHVGTNDLRDKTSRQVAESVVNLSDNILQNSTANKVSISSVIHRNDDLALNSKISECNKILKSFASNRKWGYIDNSKIGSTMLNKGGLHLNHKGSSALAKNITSYLYKSHWLGESDDLTVPLVADYEVGSNSIPKVRGFKMDSLNITSLTRHIDELRAFLADQCLDIVAINETRLDSLIADNLVHVDGYSIVRKDRNRNGGGVCFYLRSTLNYRLRDDLILGDEFEVLSVDIMKPNSKAFNVTAAYRPPNCTEGFFENLENLVRALDLESEELIILGDLNCNYLANSNTAQMTQLKQLSIVYHLSQLIIEPTRITPISSTLIDVILSNDPSRIISSGVLHIGISDHSLVHAVRKFAIPSKNAHKYITTRSFKYFKAQAFRDELKTMPWNSVQNLNTPDEMFDHWCDVFISVANKHAPVRNKRVRNKKSPWLSAELKKSMINGDKLKKQAVSSNDPLFWKKFKKERNRLNNEIKKAKADYYKSQVESNIGNPKAIWKCINQITHRKSTNNSSIN